MIQIFIGYYLLQNISFIYTLIMMPKPKTDGYNEMKKAEVLRTFRKLLFRRLLIMNIPPTFSLILWIMFCLTKNSQFGDFLSTSFQASLMFFSLASVAFAAEHQYAQSMYLFKKDGSFSLTKVYYIGFICIFVLALVLWLSITIYAFFSCFILD